MFKRLLISLAVMAFAVVGFSSLGPAQAAPKPASNGVTAKSCGSSDPAYVQANKKTDTVTVVGNISTDGNNFYCYTNIPVTAGDTVTFDFIGTCGGGAPRIYLQFDNGDSAGENTHDAGTCTMNADGTTGSVTYTIMKDGVITAFAAIHDRDNGQTTYKNIIIGDTKINF